MKLLLVLVFNILAKPIEAEDSKSLAKKSIPMNELSEDLFKELVSYKEAYLNQLGRSDIKSNTDEQMIYLYYDIHMKIYSYFAILREHFKDDINKIVDKKIKYENTKIPQIVFDKWNFLKICIIEMIEKINNVLIDAASQINPENPDHVDLGAISTVVDTEKMINVVTYIFKESINNVLKDISGKIVKANEALKYKDVNLFENNNLNLIFRNNNNKFYQDVETKMVNFLTMIYNDLMRYLNDLRGQINSLDNFGKVNENLMLIIDQYKVILDDFKILNIENNQDYYDILINAEQILLQDLKRIKKEKFRIFGQHMGTYFRKSIEILFSMLN